jgi:acyl transferase domain-containing protein/NADPH:quinone reductase-like Zn-dependent oxidoreductase/short-subunit dehydrogenase
MPGDENGLDGFWNTLNRGESVISDTSRRQWAGRGGGRWAALLAEVDRFDAEFFGIAPREATMLDPQQRLLLEVSWEATESAGIPPSTLRRSRTGIFVGCGALDYQAVIRESRLDVHRNVYSITGNGAAFAAGRLAYFFGTEGPCFGVDTSCSSSLVALHVAVESLRARRCDLAFAAGVNLILSKRAMDEISLLRALSPTGRCRPFDASADGFVRGEGCGVVVLRRLEDAERSGERAFAIVRGSAMNHDGRSKGMTVPNVDAQERLLRDALDDAGVPASDIGCVETHGTGTPLGDPVEFEALRRVMAGRGVDSTPCFLGSVKSLIGHLEAAAGIAGVLKVILSITHDTIPRQAHFETLNPRISFADTPFCVPLDATPWARSSRPRIAGVSSFGMSGTNVHVVVEEPPAWAEGGERSVDTDDVQVLPLSARTRLGLRDLAARYALHFERSEKLAATDAAFTASLGRDHFEHRFAVVGGDAAEWGRELTTFVADCDRGRTPNRPAGAPGAIGAMFTGQGAQYASMGRELYEGEPVFRDAIDLCDRLAEPELGKGGLKHAMWQDDGRLHETQYTQPAMFALGYALNALWQSWGVAPDVVMGHSVGEYVAACVAGVMAVEDAFDLVLARGRLMQTLTEPGAMLAVQAGEREAREALFGREGRASIAAVNGPQQTVIGGAQETLDAIGHALRARGIKATPLTATRAFHSPLVEPMLDSFAMHVARVSLRPPRIGMISNVTGTSVAREVTAPEYWVRHAREPVRFHAGVCAMLEARVRAVIEMGPHPTLTAIARDFAVGALFVPSLRRGTRDRRAMLRSLADLYAHGVDVAWRAVARPGRRFVSLPAYPFRRTRFWVEGDPTRELESERPVAGVRHHPVLGECVHAPGVRIYGMRVGASGAAYRLDHRVGGRAVVAAAELCALMRAAGAEAIGEDVRLQDVAFRTILPVPDDGDLRVNVVLTERAAGAWDAKVASATDDAPSDDVWTLHVTAVVTPSKVATEADETPMNTARGRCSIPVPLGSYYSSLATAGLAYGDEFRTLENVWLGEGEAFGELRTAPRRGAEEDLDVQSAQWDGVLQVAGALLQATGGPRLRLPVSIDRIEWRPRSWPRWVHARVNVHSAEVARADLDVFDASGRRVGVVEGLRLQAISDAKGQRPRIEEGRYAIDWQPLDRDAPKETRRVRVAILDDGSEASGNLGRALQALGAQSTIFPWKDERAEAVTDSKSRTADALDDDWDAIVCAWPLREPPRPAMDGAEVAMALKRVQDPLLALMQRIARRKDRSPRLWIVTRQAHRVSSNDREIAVVQSSVWGMGRVMGQEHPDNRCTCADLDAEAVEHPAKLAEDIAGVFAETEVAYRGGRRFVPRLRRLERPDPSAARTLVVDQRGQLDTLRWVVGQRRAPGPGEVEIAVVSAGLNFRDVLLAMGRYPGQGASFGCECAGIVERVGDGVAGFRVGDAVLALADGAFSSYVTTAVHRIVRKPKGLSWEQAATLPVAFLTAYLGLFKLANLTVGQQVLIHAAAGGVGMAAVQLARMAGANVLATASPSKWQTLRDVGVRHIMNSRTTEFAEGVRAATGGRGVDIVLNALTGDSVAKSMSVLKPEGVFLEMGKVDLWPRARAEAHGVSNYRPFDLGELEGAALEDALAWLVARVQAGELTPLPLTTFPIERAVDAFRYMSQARHVGKVVLTFGEPLRSPEIVADRTYLITGGMGALGLWVAEWLIDQGARHLILIGRQGAGPAVAERIASLRSRGAVVYVLAVDLADEAALRAALADVRGTAPSIRGVVHAAGIVEDALVVRQDGARFGRVMRGKAVGGWNLMRCLSGAPLDFCVFFSSIASLLGGAGQSNYAAANAFIDALAQDLGATGTPVVSINWGPWANAGMAARAGAHAQARWDEEGLGPIEAHQAMDGIRWALAGRYRQVAIAAIDEATFVGACRGEVPSLARGWRPAEPLAVGVSAPTLGIRLAQLEPSRRYAASLEFVECTAKRVLGLAMDVRLPADQLLSETGLESLMAVELCDALARQSGLRVPATLLFDCPTPASLARYFLEACGLETVSKDEGRADDDERPVATESARTLAEMSIDELASELASELALVAAGEEGGRRSS